MLFDLVPAASAFLACALLGAAIIRGYTGFGFSAIFIACASLVANPLPFIPVVFMVEITMTLLQARGLRGHIDWQRARALLSGAALALPVAIWVMLQLPAQIVQFLISAIIAALSAIMLGGWVLRQPLRRRGHVLTGMVAGCANAAGVGGLPVAACLGAQPIPAATFRATMIVFLTGIDLMTLPLLGLGGQITADTFVAALMAVPFVAAGILLGNRRFAAAPPATFRRLATWLLLSLSVLGMLRSLT
ncbi:sulfite exporter TauE/SafE family protein [Loktanella sp. R86503]|uniref:sulfite exporter TauE/SafE family protein n=1 Tax=Loktanella sp. R86503 TaxID=3093847 RepID=UPI0036DA8C77